MKNERLTKGQITELIESIKETFGENSREHATITKLNKRYVDLLMDKYNFNTNKKEKI